MANLRLQPSERVLKIGWERDCERGGVDGEARGGSIFETRLVVLSSASSSAGTANSGSFWKPRNLEAAFEAI